jgi:hypothetical protein
MPTISFTIGSDVEDGSCYRTGAVYPPADAFVAEDGSLAWAFKHTVNNEVDNGFFRWDTSAIPDTATITAADLKVYVTDTSNADSRSFTGDWYDFGGEPSVLADWAATPSATAFSVTIASITELVINTISLTNPNSNINKGGYTGIRIGISGGAPTGQNSVSVASFEHADPSAELSVTYTPEQAGFVPRPAMQSGGVGW